MRPLEVVDIAGLEEYEGLRDTYREAVIAHKRRRRLAVGDKVTLIFEDRETLRFQIQEMLRVERIADPAKVQHEIDVYNELMPGPRELSATLMIEIVQAGSIRPELDRLVGIDEHVFLELGGEPILHPVRARFDAKQLEEDRISAVQYIRFALEETQAARFSDTAVAAAIRIDHPNYDIRAEIPPLVRASLAAGLFAEPESLLARDPGATATAEVLMETSRVTARASEVPGQIVVETRGDAPSLLDADQTLLLELFEVVQRVARTLAREHRDCRITSDFSADGHGVRIVVGPR